MIDLEKEYSDATSKATAARLGVMNAADINADMYADAQKAAQKIGIPVSSVLADPSGTKKKMALGAINFDDLAAVSPATASILADQEKAKISHDDIENMSTVETLINSFKRGVPAFKALSPSVSMLNNAEGLNRYKEIDQRIANGEDPKSVLSGYGDYGLAPLPWQTSDEALAGWNKLKSTAIRNFSSNLQSSAMDVARLNAEQNAIPLPSSVGKLNDAKTFGDAWSVFASDPMRTLAGVGPQSMLQSLPGMLAAIPSGIYAGPAGAAGAMGINSFLTDYASNITQTLQSAGVDTSDPEAMKAALADPKILTEVAKQSANHAAIVGSVDALSGGIASKIAMPKFIASKLAGKPLSRELLNIGMQAPIQGALGAAGEAGGELYAGQELQPGQIASEFLGEFFGTPMEVVSASGKRLLEIKNQAHNTAQIAEQINQAAAASKVLQRSQETFQEFVKSASEDGPVDQVFIDAKTLMQSGVGEDVAMASPSVAAQLPQALQTGGQVSIPIDEYMTHIAPKEFAQSLVDHVKFNPEDFSRAEAQQYESEHGEALRADIERLATESTGDQVFKQSADNVRSIVQSELDRAGRWTPDVNKMYSSLVGSYYATQAAKLGFMPEELYKQYPLKVSSILSDGVRFNQSDFKGVNGTTTDTADITGKGGTASLTNTSDSIIDNKPNEFHRRAGSHDSPIIELNGDEVGAHKEYFQDSGVQAHNPSRPAANNSTERQSIEAERNHRSIDRESPDKNIAEGDDNINLQVENKTARGSFSPDTLTVSLLQKADLSTFLHETGHFFLHMQMDLASRITPDTEGAKQYLADTDAILKWFGIKSVDEWHSLDFEEQRDYHEQFARGFEAYLFRGKAPSIELQGVFQRYRAWLLNIYKNLKNLNVKLTDDVRGVFDRMLATNDEIQLAEQGRSMMPLFTSAKQIGMTPEEFAAYQSQGIDSTHEAIDELQARGLRDMQWLANAKSRELKKLQKAASAQRSEVRMEIRTAVMSQPVYRAWAFFTGKPQSDSREDQSSSRLNTADIKGMGLPEDVVSKVQDRRMTSPKGIHPDIMAEQFGFTSGDEMVRALADATPPKEAIEAMTDSAMLERYGDLATPEAIDKAADKAVHNEVRARFVATEANALARATGSRKILASAAKEYADIVINRVKIRNITPGQYANAETRAAKAAEKAMRSNDLATAAAEKRNQLVQNYLTRAAYNAKEEVDKGLRYLKKFDKDVGGLDADYRDQIDALLERFDLRKSVSGKQLDRRASLTKWLEAQRDAGMEPDIPAELENEAYRTHYKNMSVEEFKSLVDSVKQIEHMGRLKNRLLTAANNRLFEDVRDEMAESINLHAGSRTANTRTPTTKLGRSIAGLKRFGAAHVKAATWARILDGGNDGGPVWEYLVRSANKRGDMETTMRAEATAKLSEILQPVFALGKMGGKGKFFQSIGKSLNREARMAVALNMGNESNIQRLLGGEGWSIHQVTPILESMTAAELHAVQEIWDHFESYRPQIAEKERRVYGKEPDWLKPHPLAIMSADGIEVHLRGGYYPVKFDPAASQRAEEHADAEGAKREMQGAYTSATTRRSFTKSRAEEVVGRPLLYSLAGLYSGVNEVIHDLSWHEWLIDANRLLRSNKIDSAIRDHYGPEVKQQLKTWVKDIAEGDKGASNEIDVALSRLRQGVSVAGLGFNVMSAAMQPLGYTQSISRIGAKWAGAGLKTYLSSPIDSTKEANEKSEFMANRSRTRFRELNELRNQVQDQSAAKEFIGKYAYFLMMRCQQAVDVPTWHGAYQKAQAEGNDEDRSVALADQAVIDSQGGGQTKDLSAIERGGPTQKLFTVFYSFMDTALNLGVMNGMTEKSKAKQAANYLLLYVIPPALGVIFKAAITPGDDDDDLSSLAKKLAAAQVDYLMGLFVVVREFSEAGKIMAGVEDSPMGYSGPAGVRMINDTVKFAQQAHQGEFDDAFRKASINLAGDVFGLPSAQLNRSITGAKAISDGKTNNPAAVVFGFQERH